MNTSASIQFDPDAIFQALEAAREEKTAAEGLAHSLEKQGEILEAKLMIKAKQAGEPISICKAFARASDEWGVHVKGESVAVERRSNARSKYENLRILASLRQSQETSARQLTR